MGTEGYPIWPPYEAFYIESMLFNTTSACRSIDVVVDVVEHLHRNPEGRDDLDSHDVLDQLQNIVVQGGAISRYLWPVRSGHERRADQLRQALSVDHTSALDERSMRNDIEHFDEKLDRYLAEGVVGTIIPDYFGPRPMSEGVPTHFFRAYYVDEGEFQLLGKTYAVQPIANELVRLHNLLVQMSASGGRLQPRRASPGDIHDK